MIRYRFIGFDPPSITAQLGVPRQSVDVDEPTVKRCLTHLGLKGSPYRHTLLRYEASFHGLDRELIWSLEEYEAE